MTLAFNTRLGRCTLVYGADGVRAITLNSRAPADRGPHAAPMRKLAANIARAIAGWKVDFRATQLATTGIPPFHAEVYRVLLSVPWGVTLSYGELAAKAGRPGAARAVGQAMARNRWAILVPCHRVIQSDGSLGGYGGPSGVRRKRALLDAEGGSPPPRSRRSSRLPKLHR